MVSLKLLVSTKPIVSTSIAGKTAMMALGTLFAIVPVGPIIILTNILTRSLS